MGCVPRWQQRRHSGVWGLVFDETVRFYEDGTFHLYPKNTFILESTAPQMSGEYKVLTVEGTATSAQGEMQLTLTSPAPLSVRAQVVRANGLFAVGD